MTDRTTKTLLALIALGLWANALIPLFRPMPVAAQDSQLESIDSHLSKLEMEVSRIGRGTCLNGKIC